MPADPAPAGAKPKGKVPVWAWVAAVGVGLVVGFVFLRKAQPAGDAEQAERAAAQQDAAVNPVVAEPLDMARLQGLGLAPTGYNFGDSGVGSGGDSTTTSSSASTAAAGPDITTHPGYGYVAPQPAASQHPGSSTSGAPVKVVASHPGYGFTK